MSVDIEDIIMRATFCDDRLRVWGWQGVEFPVFPLTCVVALTTLSHSRNTVRVCDYLLTYLLTYLPPSRLGCRALSILLVCVYDFPGQKCCEWITMNEWIDPVDRPGTEWISWWKRRLFPLFSETKPPLLKKLILRRKNGLS